MSRAKQVWIYQNLNPDQILRGNGKRYESLKPKPVFTDAELKDYYDKNKKYIEADRMPQADE